MAPRLVVVASSHPPGTVNPTVSAFIAWSPEYGTMNSQLQDEDKEEFRTSRLLRLSDFVSLEVDYYLAMSALT
jgi:hypothetical protein